MRLAVGHPTADTEVHASLYNLPSAAIGYAMERFAEKYPEIDGNLA